MAFIRSLSGPRPGRARTGFSLVELMVVVAIIGVLAAIAVPQYQKFAARAMQAESKTLLSHVFTAQKAYFIEADTYIGCMNRIGVDASPGYYAIGFGTYNVGQPNCDEGYDAAKSKATGVPARNDDLSFQGTAAPWGFTLGSRGRISNNPLLFDEWRIDHERMLTNITEGY